MFCSECGAKNKKTDDFCSECGAALEKEEVKNDKVNKTIKNRKPMSKKNKIIIIVVAVLVLLLGILYKVGSDVTNPKSIAKDYIKALINQDGDKLYNYLDIEGDKTFVSKKAFKEIINGNKSESDVVNYKITDVVYGDGKLSATVKFKYTLKGSDSEHSSSVKLTKQKGKKYLFFDNWKVSNNLNGSSTINNYTIKAISGSKLTLAGIKLTDKYLDKDKSTSKLDVYVLPQVFTSEMELKTVLPNGLEIEEMVTPSSYYSDHTVKFSSSILTDSTKEKIANQIKESLTTIYTSAIGKKSFSDIKSNFEYSGANLTDLESDYKEFVSDLEDASNKLTSIEFTDVSIYDIELNDDGYFDIELSVKYKYNVEYKSWNDEVKNNSSNSYSYMDVVVDYNNDSYYLIGLDDLETYFSRY